MDKEVLKVRINNRITAHLMHGAIVPGVEDAIIDIIAPELEKAEKWEKVEEAVDSCKNGGLSEGAFFFVVGSLVETSKISKDDIEWAVNALNQPEVKP